MGILLQLLHVFWKSRKIYTLDIIPASYIVQVAQFKVYSDAIRMYMQCTY